MVIDEEELKEEISPRDDPADIKIDIDPLACTVEKAPSPLLEATLPKSDKILLP